MRGLWGLLATLTFFCVGEAGGAETGAPALTPLPEGDHGIASKYPGDVGIDSDPAVVFHDGFEDCAKPSDLGTKWEVLHDVGHMRIAEEPANVHHGKRAVELVLPQQQGGRAVAMNKILKEERDALFLRFYSKYEKGYDHGRGSSHDGGTIAAHYFPNRRATPGIPADGHNKFLANFESGRRGNPSPGPLVVYCYHAEQGGDFGDQVFPTGKVVASRRPGNPMKKTISFGPEFVSRPDFMPELDRWYCYEFMVQANTPGRRDGRIACWVDGKLIADFPNMRLRDVESLKIDWFAVGVYLNPNTTRTNKKWFDDVVAATSYIGPLLLGSREDDRPNHFNGAHSSRAACRRSCGTARAAGPV